MASRLAVQKTKGDAFVIQLTRLNKTEYYLNPDLIEMIETMPDTTITTLNGKKLVVLESIDQIVEKILTFRGRIRTIQQAD